MASSNISRITAQGQISIPADIRRKLGVGPGSLLEWDQDGDRVTVRRAGSFTSEDIHQAVFGARVAKKPLKRKSISELKQGIADYVRERYARG